MAFAYVKYKPNENKELLLVIALNHAIMRLASTITTSVEFLKNNHFTAIFKIHQSQVVVFFSKCGR